MKAGWWYMKVLTQEGELHMMTTPLRCAIQHTDPTTDHTPLLELAAHCYKLGDPGEIRPTLH